MQECYALLTNTFLKCGKELFELDTLINDISLNDENELATLLVLAEYGNAKAQYRLALRYKNGHGVTRDDAKALQWFHASKRARRYSRRCKSTAMVSRFCIQRLRLCAIYVRRILPVGPTG